MLAEYTDQGLVISDQREQLPQALDFAGQVIGLTGNCSCPYHTGEGERNSGKEVIVMKKCPICEQQVDKNPCVNSSGKCTECGKPLSHKEK